MKLTHYIRLYQGGIEVTFKLSEGEFNAAKDIPRHNFAWFAWADYELSPAKRKRFNNLFDYHKGDFLVVERGTI